jgi:hypothetical protein
MKSQDFSSILRTFADVLDVARAPAAREQIKAFAAIFDVEPSISVSALAKRIASLKGTGHDGNPSLGDIARLLSALNGLLNHTAKSAVLNDVKSIEKLLYDRASMEISAFVRMASEPAVPRRPTGKQTARKVRDDLVANYKEKLEASLGDEEKFSSVYNDLRSNAAISKAEIIALAKEMTGRGARTEDAALTKILNRHRSLVVFKAKSRATGGRSAA